MADPTLSAQAVSAPTIDLPSAMPVEWWPAAVETLFAASGTGVGLVDRELRYLYVNAALAELNGASPAAHLGRTVREVIPGWAEMAEPLLHRVMEEGTAVTGLELSGLGDGRTYAAGYHPLRVDGRVEGVVALVADVTEARAAEAALREQEALFALLMGNVPQAFFYVVDPEGPRLRYVSPAYERIFSVPAAELYEDPGAWMRAVHPDDLPLLRDRIGRDRDRPTEVEYRVVGADGGVRRVRDRAFPVRDDAGEVRWIAGVGEDVTEAHAAAERQALLAAAGDALASSLDADQTLRTTAELLVPALADYCMIFTPDGEGAFAARVWRHADPALEAATTRFAALHRVRGDEPGSLLARAVATGETLLEPVVDVEELATMRLGDPERMRLLRALGPRSVVLSGLSARGQRLGVMLLVHSASGRRYGTDDVELVRHLAERIALALDNARLYEAEQASRRAAERSAGRAETLRRIAAALNGAASAGEVARVIVEDGARALHADAASLAAVDAARTEFETLALTGWDAETARRFARFPLLAGRPTADTVLRREPVFIQSREEMRARYPGQAETLEQGGLHAFAALPLFSGDRAVAVVSYSFRAPRAFAADERTFLLTLAEQAAQALDRARLYEAEREARAEAEAANRAKTEFLAVMSHELRTPLNAIDGYAELLEMGLRGPVTDAQRSDLARIRRSQRHLLGLINDVLNFARVEAGHVELAIADVSLAEIVEGLEALVAPQVMERGLSYDCPPADPSLVARADPEKVRQILLNLLSNAVKFTAAGGTVRVTAGAEDGRVRIRVRDTGSGIPVDRLESIFEPFVQLDRNLTSGHQGTGLGLAISRDLARAMGGDLAAESVAGEGSVFTLSLPRAE
jgi:PAS domain S-box-containing protein